VSRYSQHFACERCGRSFEQLNPHQFSFNSPLGWCPSCEGLGVQKGASPALVIRDPKLSLRQGALSAWPELIEDNPFLAFAEALARHVGFSLDAPFEELTATQQRAVLHGTGDAWIRLSAIGHRPSAASPKGEGRKPKADGREPGFQYKGIFPAIDEAARISPIYRGQLDQIVSDVPCSTCGGSRLRDDAAA